MGLSCARIRCTDLFCNSTFCALSCQPPFCEAVVCSCFACGTQSNTKEKAGGLEGYAHNRKTWNFGKPGCTKKQTGRLQKRLGQWTAQQGGPVDAEKGRQVGYRKGQADELQNRTGQRYAEKGESTLMCSLSACLNVQFTSLSSCAATGQPFCTACQSTKN